MGGTAGIGPSRNYRKGWRFGGTVMRRSVEIKLTRPACESTPSAGAPLSEPGRRKSTSAEPSIPDRMRRSSHRKGKDAAVRRARTMLIVGRRHGELGDGNIPGAACAGWPKSPVATAPPQRDLKLSADPYFVDGARIVGLTWTRHSMPWFFVWTRSPRFRPSIAAPAAAAARPDRRRTHDYKRNGRPRVRRPRHRHRDGRTVPPAPPPWSPDLDQSRPTFRPTSTSTSSWATTRPTRRRRSTDGPGVRAGMSISRPLLDEPGRALLAD